MHKWHRDVIIDTAKALIPCKQQLRLAWRRISPYSSDPRKDEQLFLNAIRQIDMLRNAGIDIKDRRVLEIGSGWHPIPAMVFLAAGAKTVTLTDVEYLMDSRLLRSAMNFVLERKAVLEDRIGRCNLGHLRIEDGTLESMLKAIGISYRVPYRTEMSGNESYDLICSCSVLEHISGATLAKMIADFRRILSADGAMVHFIDNSDHFEQRDKSISRINFLKHEDWFWKLCCLNPQNFQNRLRHSDYLHLFEKNGFHVVIDERLCREKELLEVQNLPLASRYRGRDYSDLATISSSLVITR